MWPSSCPFQISPLCFSSLSLDNSLVTLCPVSDLHPHFEFTDLAFEFTSLAFLCPESQVSQSVIVSFTWCCPSLLSPLSSFLFLHPSTLSCLSSTCILPPSRSFFLPLATVSFCFHSLCSFLRFLSAVSIHRRSFSFRPSCEGHTRQIFTDDLLVRWESPACTSA